MEASRTAIRVVGPPISPRGLPRFRWPLERHLTPTHCTNCGARLIVTDEPTASERLTDVACLMCSRVAAELISDLAPVPMTPEQFRALPIQQPKRGRPPSAVGTLVTRIVRLLGHGVPMTADVLADSLNISAEQARNAVGDARKQGHDVIWTRLGYVVEGAR